MIEDGPVFVVAQTVDSRNLLLIVMSNEYTEMLLRFCMFWGKCIEERFTDTPRTHHYKNIYAQSGLLSHLFCMP